MLAATVAEAQLGEWKAGTSLFVSLDVRNIIFPNEHVKKLNKS